MCFEKFYNPFIDENSVITKGNIDMFLEYYSLLIHICLQIVSVSSIRYFSVLFHRLLGMFEASSIFFVLPFISRYPNFNMISLISFSRWKNWSIADHLFNRPKSLSFMSRLYSACSAYSHFCEHSTVIEIAVHYITFNLIHSHFLQFCT